jgi:hypothetical protein
MKVEALKAFKSKNGRSFRVGDLIEAEEAKALHLIERGFAKDVSCATNATADRCRTCASFQPDPERGHRGLGFCQVKDHHVWTEKNSGCVNFCEGGTP